MQFGDYPILFYILAVWGILWKGIGLWKASRNDQRIWFIAILVINSVGILEIIYLFKFAKTRLTIEEMKTWPDLLKRKK